MNLILVGRVQLSNYNLNSYNNVELRIRDTKNAFLELVKKKHFTKIIIADSSNVEIFTSKEILEIEEKYQIKIEQQVYFSKDHIDKNGGIKSASELVNIHKVLSDSKLLLGSDSFYKITPRYDIVNLKHIIEMSSDYSNFYFDFHFPPFSKIQKILVTSIFKESVNKIITLNLEDCLNFLDEPNGIYIEHLMFDLLRKSKRKYLKCEFPIINTISGTTGVQSSMNYFGIRDFFSKMGLMAFTTID